MIKLVFGIDKSSNHPQIIDVANCITSREDRGVSNRRAEGTAIMEITACAMRGRYNENGEVEQQVEISNREVANAITTVQKDSMVAEPAIVEDFYKNREERVYTEVAPTLRSERLGLKVVEPTVYDDFNNQIKKDQSCVGTITPNYKNPTLGNGNKIIEPTLRIRKLTPKECWRLMGFTDEDFSKAEKVNSNTQLYKQAGNSIVVPVLEGIIGSLHACGVL